MSTLLDLATRVVVEKCGDRGLAQTNRSLLGLALYRAGEEGGIRGLARLVGHRVELARHIRKGFEWGLVDAVHRLSVSVEEQSPMGMRDMRLIVHPGLKEADSGAFGRAIYATSARVFEDAYCPEGSIFLLRPADVLVMHTEDFGMAQVALRYPQIAGMLTLFEDRPEENRLIQ